MVGSARTQAGSACTQYSGFDSENSFLHTPMVLYVSYFIANQSAYGTVTVRKRRDESRNEVKQ